MNITAIVAKSFFLRRHPEAWDAVIPHWPIYKTAITEYAVATLARQIGKTVQNQQFAAKLEETARVLVDASSKMLPKEFADDSLDPDDLCPPYWHNFPIPPRPHGEGPQPDPWFRPGPTPWLGLVAGPSPDPWLEYAPSAIREIALAEALRDLANVTSSQSASSALKEVGEAIVKGASSRLFDDYCATPVKPHVPGPPKKAVAD